MTCWGSSRAFPRAAREAADIARVVALEMAVIGGADIESTEAAWGRLTPLPRSAGGEAGVRGRALSPSLTLRRNETRRPPHPNPLFKRTWGEGSSPVETRPRTSVCSCILEDGVLG